eukprot:12415652-Karenia_brevis.AAC.1
MEMMMFMNQVWKFPSLEVPSFASAPGWKCPGRKEPGRLLEMFRKGKARGTEYFPKGPERLPEV